MKTPAFPTHREFLLAVHRAQTGGPVDPRLGPPSTAAEPSFSADEVARLERLADALLDGRAEPC